MMLQEAPEAYIDKCFKKNLIAYDAEDYFWNTMVPLGQVDHSIPGEISVESHDLSMQLQYTPLLAEPVAYDDDSWIEEEWNQLDNLVLHSEGTGATFDLNQTGLLQIEKYKVLFPTSGEGLPPGNSYLDILNKEIVVDRPPFSVYGLVSLLHEIGHVADVISNPIDYEEFSLMTKRFKKGEADAVYLTLLSERNAWAFALKKLRPFLSKGPNSPLSLEQVYQLMYQDGLRSYAVEAKKALKRKQKKLGKKSVEQSSVRKGRKKK